MTLSPQQWRNRAKETRTFANGMSDEKTLAAMERLALEYERLAVRAEEFGSALSRRVKRTQDSSDTGEKE